MYKKLKFEKRLCSPGDDDIIEYKFRPTGRTEKDSQKRAAKGGQKMPRFSVKKPYTVVVGVIIVIILGFVAFTKLSTDLLPSMNLPYAIVMTTYQGASPEQVETVVTGPIESSMATVSNIKHISSTSSENYSLVILEFNTDANMDSVTIEMRESLDLIESYWPDEVGTPIIMKLNPDMMPVMMAAVSGDGMTTEEVSKIYNDKVSSDINSMDGVASVSASGLIESSVQVLLDEEKLADLNDRLTGKINEKFDEAQGELDSARSELENGKSQLESGKKTAAEQMAGAESQISSAQSELAKGENEIAIQKAQLADKEAELLQMEGILTKAEEEYQSLLAQESELNALAEQYASQASELAAKKAALEAEKAALESEEGQAAYAELANTLNTLQASIEELEKQENISEEDKVRLETLKARLTEVQTRISEIDARKEQIPAELAQLDASIAEFTSASGDVSAKLAELAVLKATFESQKESLDELRTQIATGKAAIEQGKAAIAQAESEVASGKKTLSQAASELSKNKALATVEMSTADAKIALGETQLEEAQNQLNETRDSTLDSSDIRKILTIDMVKGILTAQNFSMPAGYVTEDGRDYMVRVGDKLGSIEDIENLVLMDLSEQGLETVYLKDVADVAIVDNSSEVYAKMNGAPGILISVEKQNGYSTADVARRVREYMASDKVAEYGLEMTPLMDQGIYIDMVIESVLSNLIIGAILAIIVLFLFLKDIKPTFIVAVSIPVSVLFAIVLMYFTGVTMNIISLSGLALGVGMLVDNSIVVIENIYRLRGEGLPVKKAAIQGAKQVMGAIIASTLTTICIWAPIVFTEGITRQLFVDLVLTIAYSLLASLVVALTVVPMLSSKMLKKNTNKQFAFFDKALDKYETALRWSLKHKAVLLIAVFALLVGSMAGILSRGMEFMGTTDSPQISVSVALDDETTFDEAVEVSDEIMTRIQTLDDVDDVGAMLGSGLSMMSSMGTTATDSISMYVILKDDRSMTSNEVAAEIEKMTADMDCEVTASGSTMDMSALGGAGISVMIKGKDLDVLQEIASDYAGILENIEGTVDVSDGQENPSPELRVTVNKKEAMLHNLTVAQVYQQVAAVVASSTSSATLSTDTEDYSIYVRDEANENMTRQDVRDLKLTSTNQAGEEEKVALSDIAEISERTGLSAVNRDGQQRYISVSSGVDDAHNTTLVADEFKKAVENYELPEGYSVEFSGETESINEAMEQLLQLLALGIVIMYLIMVAQFQNLLSPFIVMFTVPLAFTGGFLGLLLTGNILSVIAMVGFVMLCGIIVNNGIVFIDYTNQLRQEGMSKIEALVETGRTRMRPILMTALTTILAMSTMALGFGDGSDMVQPMAIVTIGGMIYGTCLTLFVVPVIYDIFNRKEIIPAEEVSDEL